MKELPILFNAPMVRAIIDGRKTQTRRIVKGEALKRLQQAQFAPGYVAHPENGLCPCGCTSDRLWVRETCLGWWRLNEKDPSAPRVFSHVAAYAADGYELQPGEQWIPSIHMPRAASRITLDVTGVGIERLQDISDADAEAEGIAFLREVPDADETLTPRELFMCLWDSVATPGAEWKSNPWVWVVEFKTQRVKS